MSQKDLEAASGVSQSIISNLERNGPTCGVAHAISLARALDTTVEQLFADEPDSAKASTTVHVQRRERSATRSASAKHATARRTPTKRNG